MAESLADLIEGTVNEESQNDNDDLFEIDLNDEEDEVDDEDEEDDDDTKKD